ncbi:MAG: hypothetical protein LBJ00_10460 [Planctomycetaceae bacterium]|nr:hypothetical protein [Planctomycetaceae bacterium]
MKRLFKGEAYRPYRLRYNAIGGHELEHWQQETWERITYIEAFACCVDVLCVGVAFILKLF